jgi:general secretion pathway protein F
VSTFRYRAVNLEGRDISGAIQADTQKQARSLLRQQGLFPLEVAAEGGGKPSSWASLGRRPLGRSALVLLTRQWSTLLDSGLTIEQALNALHEQADEPHVKAILAGIRHELMAGHALHVALAGFSSSFDELFRAVIEAGERSGKLAEVMCRLADMLEAGHALRQKVIQSLIYPAMIVMVAFLVVGGLMTWVVPQVVSVFQHGKQALPWLTRALMFSSDILRQVWPFLLAAVVLGSWAMRRLLRQQPIRLAWHRRLMRLPVLGRLWVAVDATRMAQTLAVLIGSGVPILGALEATRKVLQLEPLRAALTRAIEHVREGGMLHRGLAAAGGFPPVLLHMIASGEASGRLPEMLERTARQQQSEVANRLSVAVSVLEPLLILLMGGVVLVIVLAILQPIIEINQMLR